VTIARIQISIADFAKRTNAMMRRIPRRMMRMVMSGKMIIDEVIVDINEQLITLDKKQSLCTLFS
jgi:hypothetical protein